MGIKSNNISAAFHDFFSRSGNLLPPTPPVSGLTATGGIINDYEVSGTYYRAHIFTSSGAFAVSDLGNISSNVEYIIVGGGGGGGGGDGGPGNDAEVAAVVLVLCIQPIQQSHHHKENLQSQFQFSLILLLLVLVDLGLQVQMPWVQMVDIPVLSA